MKRVVILVLLFFTILCTFAQNKTYVRKIKWDSPKSISHYYRIDQKNINKSTYLFFEGANYYNHQNLLPYYYELFKVNSNNNTLKIINVVYEPLSNIELSSLRDKNNIPEQLDYKYYISYKRQQAYVQMNLLPLRRNSLTGEIEKVISFNVELISKDNSSNIKTHTSQQFSSESVLKNGKWVKVRLKNDGIYKLSYSELISMGFSNPGNLKIYGNSQGMLPVSNAEPYQDDLIQNAIYFEKGSDGIFNAGDYCLFYAKGPHRLEYNVSDDFYFYTKNIYSDFNFYFLTTDVGNVSVVGESTTPLGSIQETIVSFIDFAHYEVDSENFLKSGQLWFGESFDITTNRNFDFEIPNLIKSSKIKIKSLLAARSSVQSSFSLSSGSQLITNVDIGLVDMSSYTSTFANVGLCEGDFTSSSDDFTINIKYIKSTSSSEGWLDYITLNAQRKLEMHNGQLPFRYYNPDPISKIVEFRIESANSSTKLWNITNPNSAQSIKFTNISGSLISAKVTVVPGVNEFIAFDNTNFFSIEQVGNIENQNLHAIKHRDMLIVCHPDFLSQANEIASIHEVSDGLSVAVVTPDQIYNEFSSGAPDATAIRNFVRMVYSRPTTTDTLKYLLLIGDGSFDHKSITADNINYVLTYQSKNSLNPTSSFVTDDFFGLLDPTDNIEESNSGLVDIGIGRFPVKSAIEAQQINEKIKSYLNPQNKGSWINSLCFVGDDEDNNLHMRDADRLAVFVDTTYKHFFINKIYMDAFPQESTSINESYPEVNRLISDEINNGVLIFNYTGHGGENGLAHERVVTVDNINSWINFKKLAIFMTATCEFSRFDSHEITSAGEQVLLNPNGGGIALFSTTRLVYSSPNYTLNSNFYNYVFEKDSKGNTRALGDIIRLAKNASGTENNKRNFTLLGDPALKIPLPEFTVVTDSINKFNVNDYTDTLKALTKVTIKGHIENVSKVLDASFNGLIYPLVLDKKQKVTTLGNDGGSKMEFNMQNNILYKGKASVVNGYFSFSFVVPKDISYSFDKGKISYYSISSDKDAKGYFNDFIIGGSNSNAEQDNIGPEIKLYMNDENFVSGGITNENPKLYGVLVDSSGINTVGNGIGHDISAILDKNSSEQIILNDYYESDIDNYQKGTIEYIFAELETGNHNIKVKVWDVFNNSSEKELDFLVSKSEDFEIKNIFNYPNPFTEETAFFFDHNRPNEDLEVLIQIFTVTGKLVKTINHIINSNAFRSDPINWNGQDDFGDKIGRGVYVYQIKVRTVDGKTVKKIEKLVILK